MAEAAIYPGAEAAIDFPEGFDDGEWAVAHWGDGYGWGAEARARLI